MNGRSTAPTGPGRAAWQHLARMSDNRGLFEHAQGTERDERHGYCTDDNARLLVVASRESDDGTHQRLGRLALSFVLDAKSSDGRCRNRLDRAGRWTDDFGTEDCWGRSVWALGTAATQHADERTRDWAIRGFDSEVRQRSPWPRAMAFAALGAGEVLIRDAANAGARALLVDVVSAIGLLPPGDWRWPEPRLTYANATLAEALIVAGAALEQQQHVDRGLSMLTWLLALETRDGHLSLTGVGGRGPGDAGPQFDQQPIEAAAMADACWRAWSVTGDRSWSRGVAAAAGWFMGDNDAGLPMFDALSGGAFDGLHPDAVNTNEGAESTLALVSTMQRAGSFVPAA